MEEFLESFALFGVGGAVLVVAFVQLVKWLWPMMPARWSPFVALGSGFVVAGLIALVEVGGPSVAYWVKLLLFALFVPFVAMGGYSFVKTARGG
jgi:hypothetical protein